MNVEIENTQPLESFSNLPIWARLDFMQVIPKIYFWEGNPENPRKMSEITVTGFERVNPSFIRIYFSMVWIVAGIYDDRFMVQSYTIPLIKV